MAKKQKFAEKLKRNNLQNHLDILKDFEQDFIFESSNFSAKIITENTEIKFHLKNLGIETFIAHSKILSDIKKSEIVLPKVRINELEYFQHNLKPELLDYVLNFDLTKAYPTILKNTGCISNETYEYLCNLGKSERLASIGMLARKKNISIYENGKPISIKIERKETSNYFFYLVEQTNTIMNEIRLNVNSRYLFTWVDGIYFEVKSDLEYTNAVEIVSQICDYHKLNFTHEILTNYVSDFVGNYFDVYFNKGESVKRFCIPSNDLKLTYNTYKKFNNHLKENGIN